MNNMSLLFEQIIINTNIDIFIYKKKWKDEMLLMMLISIQDRLLALLVKLAELLISLRVCLSVRPIFN